MGKQIEHTYPDRRPNEEQPEWRQDFPIDLPQDNYVSKREFTKFMVLTSFAFVVGQAWIGVQNWRRKRAGEPPVRQIASVAQIPVGGVLPFRYPTESDTCLLIRTGEANFVAYDQRCTHLACAVLPEVERGRLHCPCHRGYFNLHTGAPTAGPPRRPLPRVHLEIRNGDIYATGIELRTAI